MRFSQGTTSHTVPNFASTHLRLAAARCPERQPNLYRRVHYRTIPESTTRMKHALTLTFALVVPCCLSTISTHAQTECDKRTFVTTTSLDQSGFTVLTYATDQLDSLRWDFGDGTTLWQTENVGTGSAGHTYAAPGTYTVTLERWGVRNFPQDPMPLHCTHSITNVVYDDFVDDCGGDFLTLVDGNVVTFANRSVMQGSGFLAHSSEPLWDFGNGQQGNFLNRIYDVVYAPGTYTACLYYGGWSFVSKEPMYDCETCTTFTIGGATAVAEADAAAGLQLYPNPAGSWLAVRGEAVPAGAEVVVLDGLGRQQRAGVMERGPEGLRVALDGLAPGAYLLQLRTATDVRTLPFAKE